MHIGLLSQFPALPQYENLIEPTIEIVGDMVHLHPLVMQLVFAAKDKTKIAIVTDALMEPAPCKRGLYGGREVEVSEDAKEVVLSDSHTLAGSCVTQVSIFESLLTVFKLPLGEAVMMLSETPARVARLWPKVGSLEVGKCADLLCFSESKTNPSGWTLEQTFVHGRCVFEKRK